MGQLNDVLPLLVLLAQLKGLLLQRDDKVFFKEKGGRFHSQQTEINQLASFPTGVKLLHHAPEKPGMDWLLLQR